MNPTVNRQGDTWISRLCIREAASALAKAVRAAQRHPVDSAMRIASQRELVHAVRKALVHGPVAIRLGGERPGPVAPRRAQAIDLVLTDADSHALQRLVDSWSTSGTVPGDLVGIRSKAQRTEG